MRKQFPAVIGTLISFWLAPTGLQAAKCNPELTPDQLSHLQQQQLAFAVPDGDLPLVQRCDTNDDNWVDIDDIRAIALARNQPIGHPDDPMDWDQNGIVDLLDVRGCQQACSAPRCAPPQPGEPDPDRLVGGAVETGECSHVADFDGDGSEDFIGIFEYTGSEIRGNDWKLSLVIMNRDVNGNVQLIEAPYAGQLGPGGDLRQHVSLVPAGSTLALSPRSITIPGPGVVSYRDGKPKTLYYFFNGTLRRSFFGVDD